MRKVVLLVLVSVAVIYAAVLAVGPRALQKESPARASTADISHPSNPTGAASVITAPHVAHDAKAAAAR